MPGWSCCFKICTTHITWERVYFLPKWQKWQNIAWFLYLNHVCSFSHFTWKLRLLLDVFPTLGFVLPSPSVSSTLVMCLSYVRNLLLEVVHVNFKGWGLRLQKPSCIPSFFMKLWSLYISSSRRKELQATLLTRSSSFQWTPQNRSHEHQRYQPLGASRGMPPTGHFCLKCHFLYFDIIPELFYKVFILIAVIFGLFFTAVNPSFQNQTGRFLFLL